jgi:hypothetical protein
MKMPMLAIEVLTVLALSGCGGPPSPSDGRKQVETQIQAESNGLIRLVSFDKTNGLDRDLGGRKLYEMEYTAEIEFLDNCIWNSGGERGWNGSFVAILKQPGHEGSFRGSFDPLEPSKGEHQRVNGKLKFEKTEQGWRLVK